MTLFSMPVLYYLIDNARTSVPQETEDSGCGAEASVYDVSVDDAGASEVFHPEEGFGSQWPSESVPDRPAAPVSQLRRTTVNRTRVSVKCRRKATIQRRTKNETDGIISPERLEEDFINQCQLLHVSGRIPKVPRDGARQQQSKFGYRVAQLNSWFMMVVSDQ
jgi:hypothetical protein